MFLSYDDLVSSRMINVCIGNYFGVWAFGNECTLHKNGEKQLYSNAQLFVSKDVNLDGEIWFGQEAIKGKCHLEGLLLRIWNMI